MWAMLCNFTTTWKYWLICHIFASIIGIHISLAQNELLPHSWYYAYNQMWTMLCNFTSFHHNWTLKWTCYEIVHLIASLSNLPFWLMESLAHLLPLESHMFLPLHTQNQDIPYTVSPCYFSWQTKKQKCQVNFFKKAQLNLDLHNMHATCNMQHATCSSRTVFFVSMISRFSSLIYLI